MREVKAREFWYDGNGPFSKIKIMAVVDGYAMCRRPRCLPFTEAINDIQSKWTHQEDMTNHPNTKEEQ